VQQNVLSEKSKIIVVIENLKNNRGLLRASLFNKADGFPDHPEKALKIIKTPVPDSSMVIIEFT
jgi:uncharacterized protein (DUF2141 family)